MKTHAFRLRPKDDLKTSLELFVRDSGIRAAVVLSCVGSLSRVALRLANREETTVLEGKYEIVSVEATLSLHGSHLHMAVADGEGRLTGGHMKEGCIVFTTAEVVLGVLDGVAFVRETDGETGYRELVVRKGDELQ